MLALGGMLAAVGGLVAARSTVAPAPQSALNTSAVAAPPAPSAHARPSHAHPQTTSRPTSHASPRPARHHQAAPAAPTHSATPKPSRRQLTGQAYDVGYGVVQVRVTLTGSHITDVTALSLPQGGRSSDISSYAAPLLRQEALAAQSARIDTVSGASYTSAGYARSLQSALDASRS